ncbi:MAG: energy-coupling factor ABC transporter ATP-binding protein [Verrucomicrobia bacterium]|nr:energy-coupling factor ABC transporter ATP-binding protein [Verrucomicrobiota bacterium]MCG2678470.1 energy-coupling factor ABC transporter ATP-binding protein [Kiritimatiellia bacterium]MBU4248073.1 energy-coupling factor ABC transporter ATP-binding protein [Verrucomicrobiota bacterium]MBU4290229.1 energy-coupling factor ABC transporter ATP-binding protein [Verrucomicrobiota bacterium]MBU4430214.1 energy-coupling factor ABC transporter ATP-binding protein [Verrucomicrobiota bacterium]
MKSALNCNNATVRYAPEAPAAISGISLDIAPGERVALLGLNGSGKTTLLYACAGLVPFEGAISVCDVPLLKTTERQVRDQIGFLFGIPDDQILFPNVMDDIAFTLERRGILPTEARRKALPIMEMLGIAKLAAHSPHRLSHGQLQRVALAGTLVAEPPLLLLDEPSTALDPVGKEELAGLLVSLNAAMLMATHDLDFARRVCQRFIVLDNGMIAEDTSDTERIASYWCHKAVRTCR